ncbi:hypothetical protein GWI33_004422 [Rhynchophorus ferrugineus]|uniref:Uncharacterized protein n=1 Tax=Rhynchophorus ferrugineus TaxID=354439 RepID=A0A834IKX1_RHYFE|nr:hypothetical protein GWI33_004422 [Rhynchophorus ferrugineus]
MRSSEKKYFVSVKKKMNQWKIKRTLLLNTSSFSPSPAPNVALPNSTWPAPTQNCPLICHCGKVPCGRNDREGVTGREGGASPRSPSNHRSFLYRLRSQSVDFRGLDVCLWLTMRLCLMSKTPAWGSGAVGEQRGYKGDQSRKDEIS